MDPASGAAARDLTLRYEWNAASVPPPYHYEYIITIGPGPRGEVTFLPDYSQHDTPAWRVAFDIDPAALEALSDLVERQGVFARRWRRAQSRIVGDSQAWLKAEAAGKAVSVPASLSRRDAESIAPVYQAIRALVPAGPVGRSDDTIPSIPARASGGMTAMSETAGATLRTGRRDTGHPARVHPRAAAAPRAPVRSGLSWAWPWALRASPRSACCWRRPTPCVQSPVHGAGSRGPDRPALGGADQRRHGPRAGL